MFLEFACNNCQSVELVDVVHPDGFPTNPADQLCYQCKHGHSHNLYTVRKYNPAVDVVGNRPNGIGLG